MNNYKIIEMIGSGAYSVVYKAVDLQVGSFVAMKVISLQQMHLKMVLEREVQILNESFHHPNIIKLLKCFSIDQNMFLVFQYLPMDLITFYQKWIVQKKKKLTPQDIFLIISQLCQAVRFLHSKHIIHRDIKPENILIQPETLQIKLIDFGLAKKCPNQDNTEYTVTRWYRPLEIVLRLPYDFKADVFSVGAIFLELYQGAEIFKSSSNLDHLHCLIKVLGFPTQPQAKKAISDLNIHIEHSEALLPTYLAKISEPAANLIAKMLQISQEKRFNIFETLAHPYFLRQEQKARSFSSQNFQSPFLIEKLSLKRQKNTQKPQIMIKMIDPPSKQANLNKDNQNQIEKRQDISPEPRQKIRTNSIAHQRMPVLFLKRHDLHRQKQQMFARIKNNILYDDQTRPNTLEKSDQKNTFLSVHPQFLPRNQRI